MSTSTFACPVDGAKLQPMERQGIEIDFCPSCRGVWLDRGELDKILERSVEAAAPAPAPQPEPFRQPQQQYGDSYRDQRHGYDQRHPHKRRKSFLQELFD